MKKKIYYWSPCLNPVGTVKSTINSAVSLSKYNNEYEVKIINVCGEWNSYIDYFNKNSIEVINLTFNYHKFLPKIGFLKSRLSYIFIIILSVIPLINLLKKKEPNYLVMYLITSLPMFLMLIINFKTKFILRISGYPKLNILRRLFWSIISKKVHKVTCPTEELKSQILSKKLFPEKKVYFLPDAILNINKYVSSVNKKLEIFFNNDGKKIILAAGRLTKQKNFSYLIKEFKKFNNVNENYILVILGEGEEKNTLSNLVNQLNLDNHVYLLGHVNNVYPYMKKSNVFVLSSLWEEVGFVIVEAAMSNLLVISGDCSNGPKEFLDDGNNGYLFKANTENALYETLINFDNNKETTKKKLNAKKSCLKYTRFRHQKVLSNILIN